MPNWPTHKRRAAMRRKLRNQKLQTPPPESKLTSNYGRVNGGHP